MNFVSLTENEMQEIHGGIYNVQLRQWDRLLMWLLTGYWME